LQYESGHGDEGQETTRNDEVYDIIERFATQVKCENDHRVVVTCDSFRGGDICSVIAQQIKSNQIKITFVQRIYVSL